MHAFADAESASPPVSEKCAWQPADHPPEAYELAMLSFADGSTCRGTWNGRIWWGYDARAGRSRELHPVAWQPWAARFVSSRQEPHGGHGTGAAAAAR